MQRGTCFEPGSVARLGPPSADARYTGEGADDWAGSLVSGAGDTNADGYAEVLIGAF